VKIEKMIKKYIEKINFRIVYKTLFIIGFIYIIIAIIMVFIFPVFGINIYKNIAYAGLIAGIGLFLLVPKTRYDSKIYLKNNPNIRPEHYNIFGISGSIPIVFGILCIFLFVLIILS